MNVYVSPSNQKLLWNTISRSPIFQKKTQKDTWFKTIIGQFYENNRYNDGISLRDINYSTINYMVNLLNEEEAARTAPEQNRIVYPSQSPTAAAFMRGAPPPKTAVLPLAAPPAAAAVAAAPYTKEDITNAKRAEFDNKYEEMKREYDSFSRREIPPEIDFRDKVPADADAPITNMSELIKAEIEKRNRDIAEVAPPQPTETQLPPPHHSHKKVSWKDDMPATAATEPAPAPAPQVDELFQKILDNMIIYEEKIEKLSNLVHLLQDKINELLLRPILPPPPPPCSPAPSVETQTELFEEEVLQNSVEEITTEEPATTTRRPRKKRTSK